MTEHEYDYLTTEEARAEFAAEADGLLDGLAERLTARLYAEAQEYVADHAPRFAAASEADQDKVLDVLVPRLAQKIADRT